MILGITGCPGSGKSVLAKTVASKGWKLIDADLIGREVVEQDAALLKELSSRFGADIMGQDGKLNRRLLAQRAFVDPVSTRRLNDVVHPVLVARITDKIRDGRVSGAHTVVDCALIYEWGIEGLFDRIVCVRAKKDIRKKRLISRDGRSEEEVERMFESQMSEESKVQKADIVFTNNGAVENIIAYGLMLAELPGFDRDIESWKKKML